MTYFPNPITVKEHPFVKFYNRYIPTPDQPGNLFIFECSCGHCWWEQLDFPMATEVFVARLRNILCPKCKSKKIYLLTGDRQREAYKKFFEEKEANQWLLW